MIRKPAGFVEDELALAWCELLGVTDVTMEDSFAVRGGDAHTATKLAARIQDALGVTVSSADLMARDTLEAMAGCVRADHTFGRTSAGQGECVPARRHDEHPPLSFPQQRMWFMHEIDPDTTLYQVPTVLYLRGQLDRTALRQALAGVVARHETLRTTFPAPGGRPYQFVAPDAEPPMPETDLGGRVDAAEQADRIATAQATMPFDLATGPLMRARLVRLAPDEYRLVLTFHHIIIDGWSLEILYRELGEFYSAEVTGAPIALPAVSLRYIDYALWQRDRLRGEVRDELIRHWRAVLGDDPTALKPPTDRPRPARRSFRGAVVTRLIGPELTSRLRAFGRRERATPNMITLAAFTALLGAWSEASEVTVGIPAAGRTRPELAEMVGCLINMLPVRTDLSGEPGFRELVARTRAAVLDASAHQELPFATLVEALVSRPDRDFSPVFRVMFSYELQHRAFTFAGLRECVLDVTAPPGTAKYDLSLYVAERRNAFALTLEYDSDLYGADTPTALLAAYERMLDDGLRDPEAPALSFSSADPNPHAPRRCARAERSTRSVP